MKRALCIICSLWGFVDIDGICTECLVEGLETSEEAEQT